MVQFLSSPLTVLMLVVVLSFVASLLSDKLKAPYPTVMIGIGLALSLLRVGSLENVPISGDLILGLGSPSTHL